jgi:ABC-type lipoprotein export system ATPase subunit
MSKRMLDASGLHKSYRMGRVDLHVLRGVSLSVEHGEFVAVIGASGSGKSTLLHILGLLDKSDKGQFVLDGNDAAKLSSRQRNRIRCRDVGFIFQFYHLLGELNVLENVMIPAKVRYSTIGWLGQRRRIRTQAIELLERLGLKERLKHRPKELSGGERQRVAIARALINKPKILLADEPTGNLDSKTGRQIMELLKTFNDAGQTIVMVTHDQNLAAAATRIIHLRDGRLK